MRAVIQRVSHAQVVVAGEVVGRIGVGFLVLLGVGRDDAEEDARYIARKVAEMRVFTDAEGKSNLSLGDVGGAVLLESQFTLYADTRKGRRPSFIDAAPPDLGERLYERFADAVTARGVTVAKGEFGAEMEVELVNDGPMTIWLDSAAV